ncbi:MAG: GNAT family N-acetyltransferase [Treponema sp.]|nr:GNAT family N-acetyltransferase [Treponema sp.]
MKNQGVCFYMDIFMMCKKINKKAFGNLSSEYYVRNLLKTELEIWKKLPYYEYDYTEENRENMTKWFNLVYGKNEELFYRKCLVVCNKNNEIIGSCFLWKSYDNRINSVHWLKVIPQYENKGIGRALLTILFKDAGKSDMPIYLHTQIESYRAIKLYTDFGFKILRDKKIWKINNDINKCKELLGKYIPKEHYRKIKYTKAPGDFLRIVNEKEFKEL